MIKEEHIEEILLLKENLSSKAGYFDSSKAVLLGGPSHGQTRDVSNLGHMADSEHIYKKTALLIDTDDIGYDAIYVFKYESPYGTLLTDEECERALEAFAYTFNAELNSGL